MNSTSPKSNVAFSFLPDYRLDLSVRSLIGSRSRLQDVPKVAQLVEARVHAWFEERVVEPRVQVIGLPDLWPRMGRTGVRTGDESETASEAASHTGQDPDIATPLRGDDTDAGGLRYRGSMDPRPYVNPSRSSSYNVEMGDLRSRSQSMAREVGGGPMDDQFSMPGSLPDGVTTT